MLFLLVLAISVSNIVSAIIAPVTVSPNNSDQSGDVTVELTYDPRNINQIINNKWEMFQDNGDPLYNWYANLHSNDT